MRDINLIKIVESNGFKTVDELYQYILSSIENGNHREAKRCYSELNVVAMYVGIHNNSTNFIGDFRYIDGFHRYLSGIQNSDEYQTTKQYFKNI